MQIANAIKPDEGVTAAIDLHCCYGNYSSVLLVWFPFEGQIGFCE